MSQSCIKHHNLYIAKTVFCNSQPEIRLTQWAIEQNRALTSSNINCPSGCPFLEQQTDFSAVFTQLPKLALYPAGRFLSCSPTSSLYSLFSPPYYGWLSIITKIPSFLYYSSHLPLPLGNWSSVWYTQNKAPSTSTDMQHMLLLIIQNMN